MECCKEYGTSNTRSQLFNSTLSPSWPLRARLCWRISWRAGVSGQRSEVSA